MSKEKMSKRPPSPSNIPVPKHGSRPGSHSPKSRTPRKLPQAIVAVPPSNRVSDRNRNKLLVPTPVYGKKEKTNDTSNKEYDNEQLKDSNGVIYITENLIRKMSKEENFYRIFRLDLTLSKDLKKKIKFIENLEPLKNLQILSLAHNSIEKMERLGKLINLEILDLSDNQIEKIEGIETLQQLNVLNLEDNKIKVIPTFIGKKLKSLRTFKIARNNLSSLQELYKLRSLPDLVELSIDGNPICTLQHYRLYAMFLLRSLERLDDHIVTAEELKDADERFQQEELCHLENELNRLEKRLHEVEAEKEQADEFGVRAKDNEINMQRNYANLKHKIANLEKDIKVKDDLIESKTKELSKACEKQFKLEQELAFYKLDTKFDELWKFSGYEREDEDDEYIDEDQSAYIGKARFKANSLAKEMHLPSKAQVLNFIKFAKQENRENKEVNQKIVHDLEEALNVDLEEKQSAISEAEKELEKLKVEIENNKNKIKDMNENYFLPNDEVDTGSPIIKIFDREKARAKLIELINEAKEIQATMQELQDKLSNAEETLHEREMELKQLKKEQNEVEPDSPDQEILMNEIAAKEEQCYQMNDFVEQVSNLLQESQMELDDKTEMIRALELQLKLGEPDAQSEIKQGLEATVEKLTNHLEELKKKMKDQKAVISNLEREKSFLQRKVEQLEADVLQGDSLGRELNDLTKRLQEKEKALQDEIENNEKICEAYENLMKKVNKKKRHVGIGSRDVWHDPVVESLESKLRDSQGENERLHEAIERINNQRQAERKLFEEKLEQGQAHLEEAVNAAREAGDIEREAAQLNEQVNKLKAERDALKQRIVNLEEDLNKEKEESVPWNQIMRQLQSITDELNYGNVGRESPAVGPTIKDKKLQRLFDDLRGKINDDKEKQEDEKNAVLRELEKFQVEVDNLESQLADSKSELSKMKRSCREAEQEAVDNKQRLKETEERLKKALQEKSNNAALVDEEFAVLQSQLEGLKRDAAHTRKENNLLHAELEEAKTRLMASEEHAREVEQQLKTAKQKLDNAKKNLKDDNSKHQKQMREAEEEQQRLNDALNNAQRLLDQATAKINSLQARLHEAEARMRQGETKAKEVEFQLETAKSNEDGLKTDLDMLKNKLKKEKSKFNDMISKERKKAAQNEQELNDEIHFLKQQAQEDRKATERLKNKLKKEREENKNELNYLSEENSRLQDELMKKEVQLQKAEDDSKRLLETIARLEDENNALNDYAHEIQKEAIEMLQNEKSVYENELKDLKHGIEHLQRQYERKVNHEGIAMLNLLSRDVDELRKKMESVDRDNQLRIEDSLHAQNRLQNENGLLRHRLKNDINNAFDQINELRTSIAKREADLLNLHNSTVDPLINQYRNSIANLSRQLQLKDDELNGLLQKLEDSRNYTSFNKNNLDNVAAQVKDIQDSISHLNVNLAEIFPPKKSVSFANNSLTKTLSIDEMNSAPIHHYYHDGKWNLNSVVAASHQSNGTVHVHHHNHNDIKSKKKKKKFKEYCNIPEHEDMDDQIASLEDSLKAANKNQSKMSLDSSPLKLELKHLESKVEDAILMRTRNRQTSRRLRDMTY